MFCKNCGSEVTDEAEFCPKCGAPTVEDNENFAGAETEEVTLGGLSTGELLAKTTGKPVETAEAATADDATQPAETDEAAETEPLAVDNKAATVPTAEAVQKAATEPIREGNDSSASDQSLSPTQTGAPSPRRPRAVTGVIVGAAAVVVAVGAFVVGTLWQSDQTTQTGSAQAAYDNSHVSRITQIVAEVPGFDESATAIPVQIEGTDIDGNDVSEVQYLRPDSMEITTLPGSYDITFPGGYFTGDGKVIKAPDTTQHIEVKVLGEESDDEAETASNSEASPNKMEQRSEASPSSQSASPADGNASNSSESASSGSADADATENSSSAASSDATDNSDSAANSNDAEKSAREGSGNASGHGSGKLQPVIYVEIPALDVTDELIAMIASWARNDPEDSGKAETLQQAATELHVEAVKAEEARKAAEEATPSTTQTWSDTGSTPAATNTDAPAAASPAEEAPAAQPSAPATTPEPATTDTGQTTRSAEDEAYERYLNERGLGGS